MDEKIKEKIKSWNYRLVKVDNIYSIREIYYDENLVPIHMSEKPSFPFSDNKEVFLKDIQNYYESSKNEVIDLDEYREKMVKEIQQNDSEEKEKD